MGELLTPKQVAEKYPLSLWAVREHIRLGDFPVIRHGFGQTKRRQLIDTSDIEAWFASQKQQYRMTPSCLSNPTRTSSRLARGKRPSGNTAFPPEVAVFRAQLNKEPSNKR